SVNRTGPAASAVLLAAMPPPSAVPGLPPPLPPSPLVALLPVTGLAVRLRVPSIRPMPPPWTEPPSPATIPPLEPPAPPVRVLVVKVLEPTDTLVAPTSSMTARAPPRVADPDPARLPPVAPDPTTPPAPPVTVSLPNAAKVIETELVAVLVLFSGMWYDTAPP